MRFSVVIMLLIGLSNYTNAQVSGDSELFLTLKKQDSLLFERGFNQCDIEYLKTIISDDLKFYHDQSGIQDKEGFFKSIRENICSDSKVKPIRKLKPNSLVVYPLYDNGVLYGVIQKGVHDFYLRKEDKDDQWTSRAKFTHIWLLDEDVWKVTKVLSYDHQSPN